MLPFRNDKKVTTPENEFRVSVNVHPNAVSNELLVTTGGAWRVKIAAPPSRGKANQELINFISELLGISRSRISIIKGHTARNKTITISGLSEEAIARRLTSHG